MSDVSAEEAAPAKGTPEYNEAMVQKFDQGFGNEGSNQQSFEAPPPEIQPMPEGGSDKFYNAETGAYDWQNHAVELQYKLDQKSPTEAAEAPTEEGTTQKADFDWDSITQSINETNSITEENFKKLQDFGIPKEVLDGYAELLQTGAEYAQQRTIQYAGGEENLNAIFQWAQTNLNEQEIEQYNGILDSPNWRMAIDSLRVSSGIGVSDAQANSENPSLVEGSPLADQGTGFASKQEMITAMGDPRYKHDPAFRNQVRMKVANSNF
tara:strand:- start:537 stop:1334 length:798 start_codon:yes stop_codon:yes gene_type:complete